MPLDLFTFPLNNQSVFIDRDRAVSGQKWASECIALSLEIKEYKEQNWLLYQDDFYLFSQYFFALLLANKNIVLAQNKQLKRLKQATDVAEIVVAIENDEHEHEHEHEYEYVELLLPSFRRKKLKDSDNKDNELSLNELPVNDLAIDANTCITLFTSGSTGEAKPIKKYWYQLANEVASLQNLFKQTEHESAPCILSTVTHKHIYGLLFKLIWPVFTHKKIICETIEYPEQTEHYCQSHHNIVFVSSPSYLARTSKQFSVQSCTKISEIFCSGGALNSTVSNEFFSLNQLLITEVYGSTETGGIAWRRQVQNAQWELFPEHSVVLSNDDTLVLNSSFLAEGESHKTDDRVELNGRFFTLLGRVDRIVKLHEKRLSLDEMEKELSRLNNINVCHCFVLEPTNNKAVLVAVIELDENCVMPNNTAQKKVMVNKFKQALSALFEPSLIPRKWRFVQELPFNSQGKLVKTALVNLFK